MKHQVSTLSGALLDQAAWLALKQDFPTSPDAVSPDHWRPSTEWAHGGPIIEREEGALHPEKFPGEEAQWVARMGRDLRRWQEIGPTP